MSSTTVRPDDGIADCGGVVPPMDRVAGTDRGHGPDCDRDVLVRAFVGAVDVEADGPDLVPIFPPAPAPPPWLALTRVEPPPVPPLA